MDANEKHEKIKRKIPSGRLPRVEKMYLSGSCERDIVDALSVEWDVTHRTIRNYLARVRDKLAKLPKITPEAARARIESMLLDTYAIAKAGTEKGPDAKSMVAAVSRLGELDGVLGTRRMEISGKDGGPLTIQQVVLMPALEDDGSTS